MLRFLPLLFALLLVSLMVYNPGKIAFNKPVSTAQITNNPPDGQKSDYNMADILASTGDFDSNVAGATFNNQPVDYPGQELAQAITTEQNEENAVLGTTTAADGSEKWIEVDLDKQQLTAWEGNKIVKQFLISSGLWNSTNRGTFYIWYKTRSQRMKGGSKELGTYYDLPNVPNNMFYDGERALHGAYWHHNFGHVMSHGCVNEPLPEAAWMFDWAGPVVPPGQNVVKATPDNPGTRVWVH
jgi:lipoprotein-anchoring transpeptidase ErfK/SrfK